MKVINSGFNKDNFRFGTRVISHENDPFSSHVMRNRGLRLFVTGSVCK